MENFVKVTSKIDGQVILSVSAINFRREFLRDGMSWNIPRDTFEEIINYPGVANMFEDGTLGVDNPEILEEYGIIPVKTITREEGIKALTELDLESFKDFVNELPKEQRRKVSLIAIDNKCTDYNKCMYLKEASGIDVMKTINNEIEDEAQEARWLEEEKRRNEER